MQRLSQIASNEGITFHGPDRDISGITADSRKVKPGALFIAIPGTQHDGTVFIDEAVAKGAVAVLRPEGSTQSPSTFTLLTAPDIRKAVSQIAAAFYPKQPETIVAVTGTSGKTSTAQFTREIWQAMGKNSASIGTLGLVTAKEQRYGSLTTPDAITLHQLLDECAQEGVTHVAMEATSVGLVQHRLDGARLKAGGFTNFSRDHLDYHGTMETYFDAKVRLYTHVMPKGSTAVLNADIPEFDALSKAVTSHGLKVISYGKKASHIKFLETVPDAKGQLLKAEILGQRYDIHLPQIGAFQAWNGLCSLGLVIASGGDIGQAVAGLGKITGVPGRLQLVGVSRMGGAVFVDYAHKPDALDNVLQALRPHVAAHKGAKLGVVFGCGGNRDKGKRPIMGGIAERLADWVIVTDDNPRHEEPSVIRQEILAGITARDKVEEIGDRTKAIEASIGKLKRGDVVIIAGKGHEPGQIVGDVTHPFDDTEVARKVLGA
jgi:UDP-N-acetylmuramoyl-L-alanyl-D-glutamate--2,6-diaminopimelate ligase